MQITKKMLSDLPSWMASRKDVPEGWLYIGDEKERYLLGQHGIYNLLVIGVNPSTASASHLDPTSRKVKKIAEESGYLGWIMANIYPLRATNPKELPMEPDQNLIRKNMEVLSALHNNYELGAVWTAWGDLIDSRNYLGEQLSGMMDALQSDNWVHRGSLTQNGNPRHPLYLKKDDQFEYFPVFDYACNWMEV
jgi:hypothetical protein